MTALTSGQIKKLNKMNRASKDATIGTRISALESGAVVSGSLAVTGAQASASAITIQTAVSAIEGRIVQASRSGSPMVPKVVISGSNLNITSGSVSWVIAADDRIDYIVW